MKNQNDYDYDKQKTSIRLKNGDILQQQVVYDQFSNEFHQLIRQFSTSESICGYAVICNIRILSNFGIQNGLIKLQNDSQLRLKYISEAMQFITNQRLKFALFCPELKKNKQEIINYCKDWVANYELSDYLKELHLQNVYFIRRVAFNFPQLLKNTQFEERERIIKDETPFQNDPYFIYYGYENKYISYKDFIYEQGNLYIWDTLGHYICGYIEENFNVRKYIILETIPFKNNLDNENLLCLL